MSDEPELYGIRNSNMTTREMWSREMFPVSFSVALVNRMWDRDLPLNYISIGENLRCTVSELWPDVMYGCSKGELQDREFSFKTLYDPYEELATGIPASDLVIRNDRKLPLGRIDIRNSVIPDAITRDLDDERMGPEISVRSPLLKSCALSMAASMMPRSETALSVLEDGVPTETDWTDWNDVAPSYEAIVTNLDKTESIMRSLQRPLFLHTLWKSEREGPFMSADAMDAFAWSDMAFTRLFLDDTHKAKPTVTRLQRCTVRLYVMLTSMLRGERPDLDVIINTTMYGLPAEKEFMMNGRQTNTYMRCDRLAKPAVDAREVTFLASRGFERMIMPERRLDMAVYYATRTLRD